MQTSGCKASYRVFLDRFGRWARPLGLALTAVLCGVLVGGAVWEMHASGLQAQLLSGYARSLTYQVEPGVSAAIRFPSAGPYDIRLGYDRLPEFAKRLTAAGHEVKAQSRLSPRLLELADRGLFLPYYEKDQTGLSIRDREGEALYEARTPEQIYGSFDEVPPLVIESLLFIENRELLDPRFPRRNPTVEWDRLARAALEYAIRRGSNGRSAGGSSLATQIEKSRHSPRGITGSVSEKLRQMASASLRVYLDGKETLAAQERIILAYLNSLPLAAVPGHGEVIGLAAGLERWFGTDFDTVNRLLRLPGSGLSDLAAAQRATAYKQVLSLLLAQRRPTFYLVQEPDALVALADSYLRLLAQQGAIPPGLRDRALALTIRAQKSGVPIARDVLPNRKGADVVRNRLVSQLGLANLYELDRLDLTVHSTLDRTTQDKLAETFHLIADPATLNDLGLKAPRLLGRGDPAGVVFSVLLYERGNRVNWLRVLSDNLEQAFSVGDGAKLDLGSTAKLRTLVTYLEVVAALHRRYAGMPPEARRQVEVHPSDRLTKWMIEHLEQRPGSSLTETLDAALERRYSASPHARFFTGGGLHKFQNYNPKDDKRVLSVRTALHRSVNLVFIRLMRDIVNYYQFQVPGSSAKLLLDGDDPRRRVYLERFADQEGKTFLRRFYQKHAAQTRADSLAAALATVKASPRRLAAALRYIEPGRTPGEFDKGLRAHASNMNLSEAKVRKLYNAHGPGRYDLNDRGYITGIHPLELWLVAFLGHHPQASFDEVVAASGKERIAAYRWLFNTRHKSAQDLRIRSLLEVEAFLEIHQAWRRLGYPFDRLVPSYATAIGSSADRPMALAELMGILVNDGVRYPTHRVREFRFAESTPYETVLGPTRPPGERVLRAEVARVAREALIGTVSQGTARRAYGAVRSADGGPAVIGGKTGTGDHRFKTFDPQGKLLEERVVSRSAAFVFFVEDRYFGVVTAYVLGEEAESYDFTSSLPVQLFTSLAPILIEDSDDLRTSELTE